MSLKKLNQEELEKLSREELKTYATKQGVVFRSKDDSKTIIRKVLNHFKDDATNTKVTNVAKVTIKKETAKKKSEELKQSASKEKEENTDKLSLTLKQVGNNLILTAEGKSYTKVIKDADKRNELKSRVAEFLKNKTKGEYKHLVNIFAEYKHLVNIFAEISSGDVAAKTEKITNMVKKDVSKVAEPVKEEERKKIEEEVKAAPPAPIPTERTKKIGEY